MGVLRVAAMQASYVLMNRDATVDGVADLTAAAAARQGAQLVVFPEAYVPGTPIWMDTRPSWDGDEDWFALLAGNAVTILDPASDRLAAILRAGPRLRRPADHLLHGRRPCQHRLAHLLGRGNVRVSDGSWAELSRMPDTPVDTA